MVIWPDIIFIAVLAISVIVSLVRGFVKELISVASWILAAFIALKFSKQLGAIFTFTEIESVRLFIAFTVIFVVVVFLGAVVNVLVGKLVRLTPFSLVDRILGGVFGLMRGYVIVILAVLFMGLTALPQQSWWQNSSSIQHVQPMSLWLKDRLPEDIADNFKFEPEQQDETTEQGE